MNPIPHSVTTDVIWMGMIEDRNRDAFGAKVLWAELSDESPGFRADAETKMELLCQYAIVLNLILQPDLSYIRNSVSADNEQTWVFTLRAIFEF